MAGLAEPDLFVHDEPLGFHARAEVLPDVGRAVDVFDGVGAVEAVRVFVDYCAAHLGCGGWGLN